MSVINATPLLAAAGGDYQISRSVRLRSSASAYFNRTPASAGNRRTFTISYWAKRGTLGSSQYLFAAGSGTTESTWFAVSWDTNGTIQDAISTGTWTTTGAVTTSLYRDPSAWYHVVIAFDTTQATATNRCKVYVNGVQQPQPAPNITQNADLAWNNSGVVHYIGARIDSGPRMFFDGYLAEIHSIDGQALTPSSFGETDAVTGVWKPKKYAGTYGTNGFYLNFADNSAATAAAIGKDSSGSGNNWTPNNISVTSGVTYDSMLDVPTMYADGGNGRGNYCVMNPLDKGSSGTISDGNLATSSQTASANGTFGLTTGKWYFEASFSSITGASSLVEVGIQAINIQGYLSSGNKDLDTAQTAYGATYTTSDIIGCAFDLDAKQMTFYKNGTSQGTFTYTVADTYFPMIRARGTTTFAGTINFGQRPFAYTPPTGFKALNTQNLPDATIKKGNAYFDVLTWTGDNSSTGAVKTRTGLQFQPDFVWIKNRGAAWWHSLFDSVRGVGSTKNLASNTTNAEGDSASLYGYVSAFTSDGFQTTNGSDATSAGIWTNQNGNTFASWAWKESASAGFDIVTYTGTGANRTVAHSLGVAPSMIIVKARNLPNSIARSWTVWHSALSATEVIFLNQTSAKQTGATTYWNSTLPTSSVFSLGTEPTVNGATGTVGEYVAYLFAEVAGFSKFGSFTGNGSADGVFVYLGFRPRFVLYKNASYAGTSWAMLDSSRNTYNVENARLFADSSSAEDTSVSPMDFTSNGFKVRSTNDGVNRSGDTIIYMAFAENPFRNSLAR